MKDTTTAITSSTHSSSAPCDITGERSATGSEPAAACAAGRPRHHIGRSGGPAAGARHSRSRSGAPRRSPLRQLARRPSSSTVSPSALRPASVCAPVRIPTGRGPLLFHTVPRMTRAAVGDLRLLCRLERQLSNPARMSRSRIAADLGLELHDVRVDRRICPCRGLRDHVEHVCCASCAPGRPMTWVVDARGLPGRDLREHCGGIGVAVRLAS